MVAHSTVLMIIADDELSLFNERKLKRKFVSEHIQNHRERSVKLDRIVCLFQMVLSERQQLRKDDSRCR